MFVVLSLLFCLTLANPADSQSVTLWEFDALRLLPGVTTSPLLPIGVANGGLATTYLYRVVQTNGNTATRTVIVSASGWFESFSANGDVIRCSFIGTGASEGTCFDQTSTASGPPTPHVIAVEAVTTTTSSPSKQVTSITAFPLPQPTFHPMMTTSPVSTSFIQATLTSTSFASPTTTNTTILSVGAIAGVTIGGVVIMFSLVILLWWWHRQRSPHLETTQSILPDPISESAPSDTLHSDACNSNDISSSYLMEQLEASLLRMTSNTEVDYMRRQHTIDMMTEILDRVRRLEAQNMMDEPPHYSIAIIPDNPWDHISPNISALA